MSYLLAVLVLGFRVSSAYPTHPWIVSGLWIILIHVHNKDHTPWNGISLSFIIKAYNYLQGLSGAPFLGEGP